MASPDPLPSCPISLVSTAFPSELILQIVQCLPFGDGKTIASLRRAHPRIKAILDNYESSITKSFVKKELRHASADFPCTKGQFRYKWLAQCVRRYDIVDDIMQALLCDMNCFAVERYNMALVNTGLLLMYQLLAKGTWQV